jgi:hypothetical protein
VSGYADIARRQRLAAKLSLQTSDHGGYLQGAEDAVEKLAEWLMGQGYGGDFLTRDETAELIRRELLEEPFSDAPGAESEEDDG